MDLIKGNGMNEKDTVLEKIKTIWSSTLCGDEVPSNTIRCDYLQLEETVVETLSEKRLEERTTLAVEEIGTSQSVAKEFQDFEVVGELGRGGMGIVYLARQKSLNREIALKVISSKQNHSEMQKRFISEAIVTADLNHPNIVPIHALSENSEGQISIAMKKVNGLSWGQLLYPKTEEEILRSEQMQLFDHLNIMCKICDAVAYAHSHNIIHRDLKPENIMIGDFGEVLVMDWGIALDISEQKKYKTLHRSEIKVPEGTPLYMAPEMALNNTNDIGVATDVYLCGAILYEILHGAPPHRGKTVMEILYHSAEGKIPKIASGHSKLDEIISKALAHNPKNRFVSILDLKKAIQLFIRRYDAMKIIDIAVKKWEKLKCKDNVSNQDIYILGDEIYNGFLQALKIEEDNQMALDGILQVTKFQAEWAHKHEDLGMLELYIRRLQQLGVVEDELFKMQNKLRTLRGFRKNIMYTLLAIFILVSIVFLVKQSYEEELHEENLQAQYREKSEELLKKYHIVQQRDTAQNMIKFSNQIRELHKEMTVIAEKTDKVKIEDLTFLTKLKLNILYRDLQLGNYDDVIILVDEQLKLAKYEQKFVLTEYLQKKNIPLDTIFLLENNTLDELFHNLCYLARSAVCKGSIINEIWRYCCDLSEKKISKEFENVCAATFLCLSANISSEIAKENIQIAKKINLPVDLWHLLSLSGKVNFTSSQYFKLEKRQGRIWATNARKNKVWFFPPKYLNLNLCNFLFFPQQNYIYTATFYSLIVLDADSGNVVQRYQLPHEAHYLRYIDKNHLAIEMFNSSSRDDTYSAIFDTTKKSFVTPLGFADSTLLSITAKVREANQVLEKSGFKILSTNISQNIWPQDAKYLSDLEQCIEECLVFDKTNMYYHFVKAMILQSKKQEKQAAIIINDIVSQSSVNFNEYILLSLYCNFYNFREFESIFHKKAIAIQVESLHNPNVDVFLISSMSIFLKKLAESYFQKAQLENNGLYFNKAFSLLEISHKFFTFSEGDYYLYLSLAKWAQQNKRPEIAQKFARIADEAYYQGGQMMSSSSNLAWADFLLFFNTFACTLLGVWIFYMWFRARTSRISDLESIGYHNLFLRNMAFLANPFIRARYTFVTYLNSSERFFLCFFFLLFFVGTLSISFVINYTGKIANLPLSLGNGYMGGKESYLYLQKLEGKVNETSWSLLVAEAEYQRGNIEESIALWKKTKHPVAYNNLGVFYSKSDIKKAISYFKNNQDMLSVYGVLSKINLAILNQKKVNKLLLSQLPPIYQHHLQFFPNKPLFSFCSYSTLNSIHIEKQDSFLGAIKFIFFVDNVSLLEMGNMPFFLSPILACYSFVEALTRLHWLPLIIILFVIVGLFSSQRKIHKQNELFLFANKILLQVGHVLPGYVWMIRRRGFFSCFCFLFTILCFCGFALDYFDGGILSSIALPAIAFTNSVDQLQPWYLQWYSSSAVVIFVLLVLLSLREVYGVNRLQKSKINRACPHSNKKA